METKEIIETVNKLFLAVDERDWGRLKNLMNDTIYLDYSSMTGERGAAIPLDQILESWKKMLPGFDVTHHQLGNYLVEEGDELANVFCYGMATHYLKNDSGNNLWVVAGTYEFELKSDYGSWRVTKMKFKLKYIDGNKDLPKMAQERMEKEQ
jgi:hypothetical protein